MKKLCKVCGKDFEAIRNKMCCSDQCRKTYHNMQKKTKRASQRQGRVRMCKLCRKPFLFRHTTDHYCKDCMRLAVPFLDEGHTYEDLCWKECTTCGQGFLYLSRTGGKGGARQICDVCAGLVKTSSLPPPTRRCHDCGKPTDNYRCEACLDKWRKKNCVPLRSEYHNDEDNYYY